jgi:hypothetical protein
MDVATMIVPKISAGVDVLRYFDKVSIRIAEIDGPHLSDGAFSGNRAGLDRYIFVAQMGEQLFQWNCRDEAEVGRTKGRQPSFVRRIGGAVLKIDLLFAEAQRTAWPAIRALKHFPFETENPFVELCSCFNVINGENDVIESFRESFCGHGF